MNLDAAAIEAAFLAACHAEIDTLKPGNVHRFAPGHGMTADTFLDAAAAAGALECCQRRARADRVAVAAAAEGR